MEEESLDKQMPFQIVIGLGTDVIERDWGDAGEQGLLICQGSPL